MTFSKCRSCSKRFSKPGLSGDEFYRLQVSYGWLKTVAEYGGNGLKGFLTRHLRLDFEKGGYDFAVIPENRP